MPKKVEKQSNWYRKVVVIRKGEAYTIDKDKVQLAQSKNIVFVYI